MSAILVGLGAAVVIAYFLLKPRVVGPVDPTRTAAFYRADPPSSLAGDRPDFTYIDSFLDRWDRFAQGSNDLFPDIQRDTGRFNAELVRALDKDPRNALGRAVVYPILQVGGFVPADSPLGAALGRAAGSLGLAPTVVGRQRGYFAGDLFYWWEAHRRDYPSAPKYEIWRVRDFARDVAIPMYRAARHQATSRPARRLTTA